MKRPNRKWILLAVVIGVVILLTLLMAPRNNPLNSGSTFSRAPDGYGAWYVFMEQQGKSVQRWRKPAHMLADAPQSKGQTFLQIDPQMQRELSPADQQWIEQGNTWIILGQGELVSGAPFTTQHTSSDGPITIETRRRHRLEVNETSLLGDRFGAIVWSAPLGRGRVIYSVAPFLAANAYQDQAGNFAFLSQIVSQSGQAKGQIWVDEYLHGYKEEAIAKQNGTQDWVSYLVRTPLSLVLVQGTLGVLVLIWAKNRRLGLPLTLSNSQRENSEAYIQALAGVLRKAGRSEFVMDVVGREERLQLQKALGLGLQLLEPEALMAAWVAQTGLPATILIPLFPKTGDDQARGPHPITEADLKTWLATVRTIHQQLQQPLPIPLTFFED
jgi:hypothetical protein